jgi:transcriptional regulator with XRE-family HTH domain
MVPGISERVGDGDVVAEDADAEVRPRKRQRLGAELRRARELSGLSGRELANRIGVSQSKVSRAESGLALLSIPEVAAWATAAGVPPDVADLLSTLTEAAYTEVHNWGSLLRDRPHIQGDIADLEKHAQKILTFQPSVVPGLLQTAEYARRVFAMFQPPYPELEIPEALGARLDRQMALFGNHQRFDFLITEAALRWRPGPPALLLAQLDRISSLSTLDTVSVGVIPLSAEAVTNTSHGFVLFEMAKQDEADAIVLVETIHANLVVNDPESIALYRTRWSLLKQMTLSGDEARVFLAAIASDIRKTMTLMKLGIPRRGAGDAARPSALHPLGMPLRSDRVKLSRLDPSDEITPFVHVERQGLLVRVLRVANSYDLVLADLNARATTLAGADKVDTYIRHSVHRTSPSGLRCGFSAPSMREASRRHLECDLGRGQGLSLFFSCSSCRPYDRNRTARVQEARPIAHPPGGHQSCASAC